MKPEPLEYIEGRILKEIRKEMKRYADGHDEWIEQQVREACEFYLSEIKKLEQKDGFIGTDYLELEAKLKLAFKDVLEKVEK